MEGNGLCEASIPEFALKRLHRTFLTSGHYMLRFYVTVFTFLPPPSGNYPEPFDPVHRISQYFYKIDFNIISRPRLDFRNNVIPQLFRTRNFDHISDFSMHSTCPIHRIP
jgi:hypothetical protein